MVKVVVVLLVFQRQVHVGIRNETKRKCKGRSEVSHISIAICSLMHFAHLFFRSPQRSVGFPTICKTHKVMRNLRSKSYCLVGPAQFLLAYF